MTDSIKKNSYSIVLLKELPVVIFFIYLAYLSWWSHEREHRMLDYALTFDHWWYFYHRLTEGSLAQWNPYSLFGRIAVQWNSLPVSISSLFFIFSEPTLETYHICNVISTWMAMAALYAMGRLLGYGRYYPLLSVPLLMVSGYRYYIHNFVLVHYFISFPLAIALLLKVIETHFTRDNLYKWSWVVLLLAISLTGILLQYTIYSMAFIMIVFFCVGLFNGRRIHTWVVGAGVLVFVVALIAWQLPFLLTASLSLDRVSVGFNPAALLSGSLWRWIFLSLIAQVPLIFALFNLIIVGIIYHLHRLNIYINRMQAFLIIAAEFLILKPLLMYLCKNLNFSEESIRQLTGLPYFSFHRWLSTDILSLWHDIIAIALVLSIYFFKMKRVRSFHFFTLLTVLFAGFYIAEYSWQRWQINANMPYFFWHPVVAGFVALGAVSLWLKKKYWVVIVLVIYHMLTETGSFLLQDVFGFPWLASRAAVAELPFQVFLLMEAVSYLTDGIKKTFFQLRHAIDVSAKIAVVIFVFVSMKGLLIPGVEIAVDGREAYQTKNTFPFSSTLLYPGEQNKEKNKWIYEALNNAEEAKQRGKNINPWKRVYVSDEILITSEEMAYKFLPAYSQTLNTAPVYAGEIPKTMNDIFRGAEQPIKEAIHYELSPLVQAYYFSQGRRGGNIVYLYPHAKQEPLYKELMAEEGSNTPRAFLSTNVIRLNKQAEEYRYLKDILSKGGTVREQITTSDRDFKPTYLQSVLPLKYTLKFERDEPEHIVFEADTNQNAYLALLDLYSPGWRTYIDGNETKIYRGYIGTRFIAVPEGRHKIEFKYRVPYLMPAMIISAIAFIIVFIGMSRNFLLVRRGKLCN